MMTRIIFGGLAACLLLGLIFFVPPAYLIFVVVGFAAAAYVEYDTLMFNFHSKRRQLRMVIIIVITIIAIKYSLSYFWIAATLGMTTLAITNIIFWNQQKSLEGALFDIGMQTVGYFYILFLFGFIMPIVQLNPQYFLLLCLLVFSGDSMAYFAGVKFGKHRLASRISPKKSLEGSVAAIIGSTVACFLWHQYTPASTGSLGPLLLFAPIASVLAQCGDLFESLLKRCRSIKDSGSFLPGHGGLLDRVDGLAFAAPALYLFLTEVWL